MIRHNISFAGAGRVAAALSGKFYDTGHRIEMIVSVSESNGRSLAGSCDAIWSPDLDFPRTSDIIIVAVPDHLLGSVLARINCHPDTLVAHTAGSIGLDIFPENIKRTGVFYPLQTFSRGRNVDFNGLPFLLESSDSLLYAELKGLAESTGGRTFSVSTEQRIMLHLAAVFICNFTNHMLSGGKQVADKTGLPFDILYPLLQETVSKAMAIGPENAQTGPAVRNDRNTIEKHMELLSFSPELQKMYREITMSIINYHSKS